MLKISRFLHLENTFSSFIEAIRRQFFLGWHHLALMRVCRGNIITDCDMLPGGLMKTWLGTTDRTQLLEEVIYKVLLAWRPRFWYFFEYIFVWSRPKLAGQLENFANIHCNNSLLTLLWPGLNCKITIKSPGFKTKTLIVSWRSIHNIATFIVWLLR